MNKKVIKLLGVALFAAISPFLYAQDDDDAEHDVVITIDEVFLVDIEGASGTSITLGPESPTEAGEPLDFSSQTNSDLWLNYSAIKSSSGSDREVTVQIGGGGGSLPSGMNLNVSAAADAGNGAGQMGSPVATITLTTSPQILINGIGSAYTANGANNGHNLTYSLLSSGTANYANIDADENTTLSILYTITDD